MWQYTVKNKSNGKSTAYIPMPEGGGFTASSGNNSCRPLSFPFRPAPCSGQAIVCAFQHTSGALDGHGAAPALV